MGTIHHTALVVTGYDCDSSSAKQRNLLTKAHKKAVKFFGKEQVTDITGTGMNGYMSFMVTPSGSKIGWDTENCHRSAMDKMIEHLESLKYEDGSTSIKYVKVSFGELGLQVSDWRENYLEAEDR